MLKELLLNIDARFVLERGAQFCQNPKVCIEEAYTMIDAKAVSLKIFLQFVNDFLGTTYVIGVAASLWLIKEAEKSKGGSYDWLNMIMGRLDDKFCLSRADLLTADVEGFLTKGRETIGQYPLLRKMIGALSEDLGFQNGMVIFLQMLREIEKFDAPPSWLSKEDIIKDHW